MERPVPEELPPHGILVVLTLAMPGAAQLALGERRKGWTLIVLTSALFVAFLYYFLFRLAVPVWGILGSGVDPFELPGVREGLVTVGVIVAAALAIMVYAAADALKTARALRREP